QPEGRPGGGPGGGHWQGGGPQPGQQPGGFRGGDGRHQEGGPQGPRVQGPPPGAPQVQPGPRPDGGQWRGGDRRFQGGPPPAVPGQPNPGAQRDWNRDRGQVTPPPADGSRWEGRHDPRGGDGRNVQDRGRDGRNFDGRNFDGRGPGFDRRDPNWRGGEHGGAVWGRGRDGGMAHWAPGRYPSVLWAQDRFRIGVYRPPYGYYVRAWGFGEFLPRPWFAEPYWITDFLDYDLPYPPPGFTWVRVGPDALMIDEYSGRIVQVVRGIFW
ncbi:MAG: RcnB family protein, partial [Proteobacteria bacterium]|nr:RcnB family protein [Pseudomonadota bacterium]